MSWPAIRWAKAQKVYSASERAVLGTLAHYARKKDARAWPSLETLGEECGMSRKSLYLTIRKLAGRGLLTIEGNRYRRKYRLCLEAGQPVDHAKESRQSDGDDVGNDDPTVGHSDPRVGQHDPRSCKDPNLNLRRRRGAAADAAAAAGSDVGQGREVGAGSASGGENWAERLATYRESGFWYAPWGPKPGEPGCRAPGKL